MGGEPRFEGRSVLVTGASSGIGRATAVAFAREGARVVAVGRDRERLAETRDVSGSPERMAIVQADLADLVAAKRVVDEAIQTLGGLHVLVNNAGVATDTGVLDVTVDEWRAVMAVNLDAALVMSQAAGRYMAEHGGGSIVNVASIDGIVPESPGAPYNVSKAALIMLTRCLAHELGHLGVRCNAVAPGQTDTPMMAADLQDEAFRRHHLDHIPLGRMSTPEEQAAAILFLASDEASYVTGATLVADGGQLSGTWYRPGDAGS